MDFSFPKNKSVKGGILKNFNGPRKFTLIDPSKPIHNLINIDNTEYVFYYLNSKGTNKGGNSIILNLYEVENIDFENPNYGTPDLILKICKKPIRRLYEKIHQRFRIERVAIYRCNKYGFQNIINMHHFGKCKIHKSIYLFYTMEYAEADLKKYVEDNSPLSDYSKIELCLSLANGLKELDSIGIFHRDLKPDNIFINGNIWKIGDLGLIDHRKLNIDHKNEKIGPKGWMSPESMNKYLCEKKKLEFQYDHDIDHQSDIFQLGKIFMYIFQNNNPKGVFKQGDLNINNNQVYQILRTMINYSKKRRYQDIDQVIQLLKPIQYKLLQA